MSRIARNLPPQEVLQHFTDLTSLDVAVRTTATTSLLRHLHPLHVSHEAPAAATASLATAESRPIPSDLRGSARDAAIKAHASDLVTAFMATLHPHVAYAYMRLVKGLPSSSKAARQGFSAALAFLLRLIRARWQYLHAAVHVYIVAVPGTNNAQDERDKLYGRLFAAVAAIESGMHKVVDGGMSEAQVHELASMLGFVAESKEYLREAAYSVAFRLADETRHAQAAMTALRSALPAELTRVDHLALSVYLESRGASVPTPLTAASLSPSSNVSDLLLQSTSVAPRMHLVWTVLLAHVLQSPKLHLPATPGLLAAATLTRIDAGTTDLPLLAPTWRAIDRTLLTSGPARAAQALHVFAFLFRVAPVEQLPALLTPNLLRVLEKTRRGPLRTHVTRAVRVIVTAALDDRRVVPIVLAAVKPSILESLRAPSRDADDSDDSDSDSDDEYDSDVSDDEDESDDEEEEDAEDESAPPVYEQLLANLTDSDLTQFIESLIEQARSLSDAGNVEDPKSVAAMYALETLLNPALAPRGAAAIAQYLFSPAHMAAAPNATARTHTFLARAAPVPESPVGLKALTDVYLAFPGKDARVAKWVKKPIAATVTAAAGGDSERAGRAARRETAARALVMAAHLVLATDAETAARATETVDEVVSVWQKYTKATAAATGGEAEIDPLDVLADVALELTANPVSWLRRLCSQSVAAFADSMTENVLALMLEALDANHADDDDEDEEKDAMDQSEDGR
ncbi:hypothetical protein BC828DRAFT_45133 [Blastocladiella britannica]|nr:hypothetical protein BC828DRAFT_45133 [Blastocladiella britannica]